MSVSCTQLFFTYEIRRNAMTAFPEKRQERLPAISVVWRSEVWSWVGEAGRKKADDRQRPLGDKESGLSFGGERGWDFEVMPLALQGLHVSTSESESLSRVLASLNTKPKDPLLGKSGTKRKKWTIASQVITQSKIFLAVQAFSRLWRAFLGWKPS